MNFILRYHVLAEYVCTCIPLLSSTKRCYIGFHKQYFEKGSRLYKKTKVFFFMVNMEWLVLVYSIKPI